MKRMRKVTAIFIAFLLLMSVFTGCTNEDSEKDTPRKTTASSGKEDESDKTAKEDKTQSPASTKTGDIITFGQYEQDNDLTNGKEPIEWRVLTVENGKAFLLADKILDVKPYNIEHKGVTWETCILRTWLNDDFYSAAFNTGEKAKIRITRVVNEDYPTFKTDGGNDTDDKVFLLSYSEATNPAYGFNSKYNIADSARRAQGTDYAKSQNIYVYEENSPWWLRTPGINQSYACFVTSDGFVYYYYSSVSSTSVGVRPALWINL